MHRNRIVILLFFIFLSTTGWAQTGIGASYDVMGTFNLDSQSAPGPMLNIPSLSLSLPLVPVLLAFETRLSFVWQQFLVRDNVVYPAEIEAANAAAVLGIELAPLLVLSFKATQELEFFIAAGIMAQFRFPVSVHGSPDASTYFTALYSVLDMVLPEVQAGMRWRVAKSWDIFASVRADFSLTGSFPDRSRLGAGIGARYLLGEAPTAPSPQEPSAR